MGTLKIAVVGFGLVGKKHAGIVQSNKDLNLCGVVENNEQLLSKIDLKCKNFKSISELLKTEEVDGAIIATPTPLHVAHAKNFVENKIPVLIEKPISNSSKESMSLLDLANKNSTKILVGHHRRHNNIIKSAKKALDNGTIGKVRSASTLCWFYKPDDYFNNAPWRKKIGAGPISINLIHDIDLLRYFCGEVKNVQATIAPSIRGYENEDLASVILQFDNGVIATMSVSDSIVSPWSWEMNSKENSDFPHIQQNCYLIGGSKGSLSIPDLKVWSHDHSPDWTNSFSTKILNYDLNDPLVDQIKHFSDVIRNKTEPLVSGEEGLKSLKVIEAIEKSKKIKKTLLLNTYKKLIQTSLENRFIKNNLMMGENMINKIIKKTLVTSISALILVASMVSPSFSASKLKLTMATSGSETDARSVAIREVMFPMISDFADVKVGYNSTMFDQGTELDAISRGNLTMSITSAQELAQFFPEFSIFATGYVHQDAAHQVKVFNNELMDPFKKKVEDELGVKLLSVMYLGKRHVNLRQPKSELTVKTPADLKGVNLRMPGTDAWQYLGKALGASPTPLAFNEVYTALQTGAVDGQDNPLPTVVDKKFYEVTKQIILTSHLVDLNYIAFSKKTWDKLSGEQKMRVQQAADAAASWGRLRQLQLENSLADFVRSKGLEIYEPDSAAFRKHVQKQYVGSEFAKSWPKGVLKK